MSHATLSASSRRTSRRGRAVVASLGCALALAGCASGPNVHEEVVHTLKDLGKRMQHADADEVLELYCATFRVADPLTRSVRAANASVDGVRSADFVGEANRDQYRALLAEEFGRFAEVKKAKHILESLREIDDGYEAETWFNLYAVTHEGDYHHEESRHRFEMYRSGEQWRIRRHEILDRRVIEGHQEHFVNRASDVGLGVTHRSHYEPSEETWIVPGKFSGSGSSAGDLDGDGYLDLLVGDGVETRLYRNRGDGTFEELSQALVGGPYGRVRGAYLVDYDGDGRLDVWLTRSKLPLVLLRNRGDFEFEDQSALLADVEVGEFESAAFGDLDGDGDLDAYVVRYGDWEQTSWAYPLYDAQDGVPSALLRNDGADGFTEIKDPVGSSVGWGLAVSLADYDDDGDLDVYKVNDFGFNHLLRNDGDFRFTDVSEEAGVSDQGFGMSSAFGDYDGDGDLDIYVANMHSSSAWVFDDPNYPLPTIAKILMLRGFVKDQMSRMLRGNSLFRNRGDGTFEQVAAELGVEKAGWAWGANFFDYDNDGDLDIYSPAGFITGEDEYDC